MLSQLIQWHCGFKIKTLFVISSCRIKCRDPKKIRLAYNRLRRWLLCYNFGAKQRYGLPLTLPALCFLLLMGLSENHFGHVFPVHTKKLVLKWLLIIRLFRPHLISSLELQTPMFFTIGSIAYNSNRCSRFSGSQTAHEKYLTFRRCNCIDQKTWWPLSKAIPGFHDYTGCN